MCTECEAKERELLYIHRERALAITENHHLRQRITGLLENEAKLVKRIGMLEPERSA